MGIRDDGCGTARHHGPGELVGGDHRALDVHVGIYEARANVASTQIYHLARLVIPQARNTRVHNRDVGLLDVAGEDVDDSGIFQ